MSIVCKENLSNAQTVISMHFYIVEKQKVFKNERKRIYIRKNKDRQKDDAR